MYWYNSVEHTYCVIWIVTRWLDKNILLYAHLYRRLIRIFQEKHSKWYTRGCSTGMVLLWHQHAIRSPLRSVAWQHPNIDKQISSHERGGGVRGVEQWIQVATDYEIAVVPDTVFAHKIDSNNNAYNVHNYQQHVSSNMLLKCSLVVWSRASTFISSYNELQCGTQHSLDRDVGKVLERGFWIRTLSATY